MDRRRLFKTIEQLNKQIEALQDIINEKKDDYSDLKKLIESLISQRDTLIDEITEYTNKKNQLSAELSFLEECKSMKEGYISLENQLNDMQKAVNTVRNNIELETKYSKLRTIEEMEKHLEELEKRIYLRKLELGLMNILEDKTYDATKVCFASFSIENSDEENMGIFQSVGHNSEIDAKCFVGLESDMIKGAYTKEGGFCCDDCSKYDICVPFIYITASIAVSSVIQMMFFRDEDNKQYIRKKRLTYDEIMDIYKWLLDNIFLFDDYFADVDVANAKERLKKKKLQKEKELSKKTD